jgi:FtsZ-binding cell division protein ZapB
MTTIEQERLNKLRGYSKVIGGISCCSTCDLIFLFDVIDEAVDQIDSMQEEINTLKAANKMTPREEYIRERAAIIWEGNTTKTATGQWHEIVTYEDALEQAKEEAEGKDW